jgi:putative metalloenzyme radical SAM/SPASM domain maturase
MSFDRTQEIDSDKTSPPFRSYPSKLFVEVTTSCNLGCSMCVKQTGKCMIVEGEMDAQIFTELESALPHAETLILNGVGEPLLHPQLESFVRRARGLMPASSRIGFQSNGLLLDLVRARALIAAGLDRICISVDAVNPEKLEQLREGAQLSALERGFAALAQAKQELQRPDFEIGAEIVVMRSNYHELPDTLRWAAEHGASFALVTHVLPYDNSHADETLYESCSAEAIALFDYWRRIAAAEEVDIGRYPRVIWKFSRSEDEQRVVEFVEELKADAQKKQIFLNLKKLFALDLSQMEQVREVFAIAESVAKSSGLDLQLPLLLLKENRRCEFVEDGSAFISWQGDVHPCYFLWHAYHCHASGWDQIVKPRVFGSLKEQPLLEIWNSDPFRSFRESVTRYDYPYCSSCALAPCDYIQTEEFEQDCHINNEPCGSCLWCMGLFQCLR